MASSFSTRWRCIIRLRVKRFHSNNTERRALLYYRIVFFLIRQNCPEILSQCFRGPRQIHFRFSVCRHFVARKKIRKSCTGKCDKPIIPIFTLGQETVSKFEGRFVVIVVLRRPNPFTDNAIDQKA